MKYWKNIDDNSSEVQGKWAGLCPKDSIKTVNDFKNIVMEDSVLFEHFQYFQWDKARIEVSDKDISAIVTHRSNSTILPTKKTILIPSGDKFITDGRITVRTHCCNDVITNPKTNPVNNSEPKPIVESVPSIEGDESLLESMDPSTTVENEVSINFIDTIDPGGLEGSKDSKRRHHKHPHKWHHRCYTDPKDPSNPVPEPAALILFGIGICTLTLLSKLRRK